MHRLDDLHGSGLPMLNTHYTTLLPFHSVESVHEAHFGVVADKLIHYPHLDSRYYYRLPPVRDLDLPPHLLEPSNYEQCDLGARN